MRRLIAIGFGVSLSVAIAQRLRRSVVAAAPDFDPVVVGSIEADGWRAYYDRDMMRGFVLLLRLMSMQFRLGPIDAIWSAYAAVRAQMAFAPKSNDLDAALRWLTRFYAMSPRRDGVGAADLARAELDYWIVHRQIVDDDDKSALIDAFAHLHALLFGGSVTTQRQSAEQRTLACNAVDRITSRRSADPEYDWRLVRKHLVAAYQSAIDNAAASVVA